MSFEAPAGWTARKLGEVAEFRNRLRIPLSASERVTRPGPYPYWGAGGPIDALDDFLFDEPHVLVAEDGNTVVKRDGRATVHWVCGRYWVNNHAHVLAAKSGTDLRWLYYALSHVQISGYITGSAQPKLSMGNLAAVQLWAPPPDEQRRIAGVLGTLDRAATCAASVVEHLEDLTYLLFKNAVDRQTGWKQGNLTDLARFVNGKNFTKDATATGRPVLRIKELRGGVNDGTIRSDVEAEADFIANHFDLLMAWSGTLGVHRWDGDEGLVNQHIFKVVPQEEFPIWFVECWLKEHIREFIAIARDKATTMGHIQRRHLSEARVLIPGTAELAELQSEIASLDALRQVQSREAKRLLAIRDALLPKLLSGRLRISEAYEGEAKDLVEA